MTINHSPLNRSQFLLDPNIIFLNHGSFGATPRSVFEAYQNYQLELEREPVLFLGRRANGLLATARAVLAGYLGTQADNLVYLTNATTGINVVARSLPLGPGDEVLTTDHEYGAIDRTWRFLAQKQGFHYINQAIPVPVSTPEEWLDIFWQGVSPRTKVISISHITSPTALIFPIQTLCKRARHAGILTIIDGAHVPGQIDLNLEALDADFYTGNLHKWLCAPKGAAFLYARPDVQHLVEPLVVSWGYESATPGPSTFIDYNQWTGTRDIAPFLAVPEAIKFLQNNHWPEVRAYCHALAADVQQQICKISELPALSAPSPVWFSQMVAAPLPIQTDLSALSSFLWDEKKIEVPMIDWNGHKMVRISVQGYNTQTDLDVLCCSLKEYIDSHK
jgi:isopenicillin-N epimerase